jgi:hypothetical protein
MWYFRLTILILLLFPAVTLHAEVRRCTAPDGTSVFTDRRCEDVGAIAHVPHDTIGSGVGTRMSRVACSRNLQDLVYEVTTAIDSRDVNRFAGVYHWVGMPTGAAYSVMGRLQAIVQRPLVDVSPLFSGGTLDDDYAQTTVRRVPTGLKLEQTLANGSTPSRTVLGLRKYLGCWWVQL